MKFGATNLTAIYGNNGSGKSGYTRILKKVCGKAHAVTLRSNVFSALPIKRSCTISYKLGGAIKTSEWEATAAHITELASVDIFDAECGKFYLGKENEASYVPDTLALFDSLVKVCEGVKQRLQNEIDLLPSKLPSFPTNFATTETARLYLNLKATQVESELAATFLWVDADSQALKVLDERLKTDDPAKLAIQKRAQAVQLETIRKKISSAIEKLSSDACLCIYNLKLNATEKRTVAVEGAKAVLESASLAGIGSQTWRTLWEAARKYSIVEAYKVDDFPFTGNNAKCVLCQQPLEPAAQKRFCDFENFVKGEIESAAKNAEAAYEEAIKALPLIPTVEELNTACQAAGLEMAVWPLRLLEFWKSIEQFVLELKSATVNPPVGTNLQNYPWLQDLLTRCVTLEEQAKQHDADALTFDRSNVTMQLNELHAKQWASQQLDAIKSEVERLKNIKKIDEWLSLTNHTAISKQAGVFAEKIITDAYIERFNNELKLLGAKRIKVELIKTRTTKGKAMHGVRLKGLKLDGIMPPEVLSDGERRIVELAAFLADVTGRMDNAPFIFDDPISSLDQDFEEKTIDRLISLSENRQVLVFTHRLSFLGILNDKATPDIVCIRHEPWGAGEPGEVPIFGKKPEAALKLLRNERLKQAENVLNQEGSDAYYPLAKAICSDFRILIERVVEQVFLADVIQRHRRAVNTQNKIGKLAKITSSDCQLVDEFMGKYSCYEHSQSSEAPVDVPPPNELLEDIDRLLVWHGEFEART